MGVQRVQESPRKAPEGGIKLTLTFFSTKKTITEIQRRRGGAGGGEDNFLAIIKRKKL